MPRYKIVFEEIRTVRYVTEVEVPNRAAAQDFAEALTEQSKTDFDGALARLASASLPPTGSQKIRAAGAWPGRLPFSAGIPTLGLFTVPFRS